MFFFDVERKLFWFIIFSFSFNGLGENFLNGVKNICIGGGVGVGSVVNGGLVNDNDFIDCLEVGDFF